MARVQSRVWALVVASSLLCSTAGIGAAERDATSTGEPGRQARQFRASIASAIAAVASRSAQRGPLSTASREVMQEPAPQPSRVSPGCSCGIPAWLKYTMIAAAAAGGGYGLSQLGHHGEGGGTQSDRLHP